MNSTSTVPRTSGGFNQGLGQFGEHLDEKALEQNIQQHTLTQQATSSAQTTTGGNALGTPSDQTDHRQPRELGTLKQELVERPIKDFWQSLVSLFDIRAALGIDPIQDDPVVQQRKQASLQRYQQLTADQQAKAQERYHFLMQKKQQELEAEEAQKQQAKQLKDQTLVMPSSPHKGPIGPGGSHKPAAVQKLEQDRKSLGGPQSVN